MIFIGCMLFHQRDASRLSVYSPVGHLGGFQLLAVVFHTAGSTIVNTDTQPSLYFLMVKWLGKNVWIFKSCDTYFEIYMLKN